MKTLVMTWILASAVQSHCDLPGGDLSNASAASPQVCATTCEGHATCKAWTYISGWNRCFLKSKQPKPVKLRIHAAQIEGDGQGGRRLGTIYEDHDDSGKDLRRVTKIRSAADCGKACLDEPQCQAFAFLDGYGDCWLKKNRGNTRPKVFYCGSR